MTNKTKIFILVVILSLLIIIVGISGLRAVSQFKNTDPFVDSALLLTNLYADLKVQRTNYLYKRQPYLLPSIRKQVAIISSELFRLKTLIHNKDDQKKIEKSYEQFEGYGKGLESLAELSKQKEQAIAEMKKQTEQLALVQERITQDIKSKLKALDNIKDKTQHEKFTQLSNTLSTLKENFRLMRNSEKIFLTHPQQETFDAVTPRYEELKKQSQVLINDSSIIKEEHTLRNIRIIEPALSQYHTYLFTSQKLFEEEENLVQALEREEREISFPIEKLYKTAKESIQEKKNAAKQFILNILGLALVATIIISYKIIKAIE